VSLDHFKVLLVGIHGSSAEGGNLANYMIFQRTDMEDHIVSKVSPLRGTTMDSDKKNFKMVKTHRVHVLPLHNWSWTRFLAWWKHMYSVSLDHFKVLLVGIHGR
jgi:hypothetical protein